MIIGRRARLTRAMGVDAGVGSASLVAFVDAL
jgi:hypothetical protein